MASAPRRSARWLIDHAPAPLRRAAAVAARRARHLDAGAAWMQGADHEMDHWRHVFADDPDHVAWMTWADAPIDPASPLHQVLTELAVVRPRVLDVGAGPMAPLGRVFDGSPIDLVAVDPLADRYNALLDELGIVPPTRTVRAEGERLLDVFPADSFDVACATNALDHCYDPAIVIDQMIEVVRPGGKVMLHHHTNEGERRLYRGMHLWNLDESNGHLVLWNPDQRIDVSERFAHAATFHVVRDVERVLAVATKRVA
jgi:SAM-dependent methyltransferase